jgi:CRISPR/Cas system-associated endonuclease Cas1
MRPRPQPKVVTVAGYGVSLTVKRGHPIVEDGVGKNRRVRRFNRATPRFDRVVVHGHSGIVSLDALRWISDIGASFIHIDHNAQVLTTSAPGHQAEPQYLVAQVESRTNGRGFNVMRRLITEKIDGQLENMDILSANPRAMRLAANHRERAANADTFKELRDAEKLSGKQYWMVWRGLPVRFESPALKKIPQHWVRFNRRRSTLTQGNRKSGRSAKRSLELPVWSS